MSKQRGLHLRLGRRGLQGLGGRARRLCCRRWLDLLHLLQALQVLEVLLLQVGELLLLQGRLRPLQGLLGKRVWVGLRRREWVRRRRGVGRLRQVLLLELQELLGLQVQDRVRRRGRLWGHLHLAEEHRARRALLAVVHLLLQCLRRRREGLQNLEAETRQGNISSCCTHLTGPSKSGAARLTPRGITLTGGGLQTHSLTSPPCSCAASSEKWTYLYLRPRHQNVEWSK